METQLAPQLPAQDSDTIQQNRLRRRFRDRNPGAYASDDSSKFLIQDRGSRDRFLHDLINQRGSRYRGAKFSTYEISCDAQQAAVDRLHAYLTDFDRHSDEGSGLILFGPPGTGKDHLLMVAMGCAVMRHGASVVWRNGLDIYGAVRNAFSVGDSEESIIAELSRPEVLAISDPLPPTGALTEFQQQTLLRVLDARYSNCRPTWVTVNVANSREMEQRLGSATTDRLRHGATAIHCNWESFRKCNAGGS